MELNRANIPISVTETFDRIIADITKPDFPFWDEKFVDRVAVILWSNVGFLSFYIDDRLIHTAMPKGEFVRFHPVSNRQKLMTKTDPKNRNIGRAELGNELMQWCVGGWITRTVGEDDTVGFFCQDFFVGRTGWKSENMGASFDETFLDAFFGSEIEKGNSYISLRIHLAHTLLWHTCHEIFCHLKVFILRKTFLSFEHFDHTFHRAMITDEMYEITRINTREQSYMLIYEQFFETIIGFGMNTVVTKIRDDHSFWMDVSRLSPVHVHAVVADHGIRKHKDLSCKRRISQRLDVPIHRCAKDELSEVFPRCTVSRSFEIRAICECQSCFFHTKNG